MTKAINIKSTVGTTAEVRLSVHIQPGAKRDVIKGFHDGKLKISVTAPPVDGRANTHVIEFLANLLKIPKRNIRIVKGETSRDKIIGISGKSIEEIHALIS